MCVWRQLTCEHQSRIQLGKVWESVQLPHRDGDGRKWRRGDSSCQSLEERCSKEVNSLLAQQPTTQASIRESPWVKAEEMQLLEVGGWAACNEAVKGRECGWDSNSPYFIGFLGKWNGAIHIEHLNHGEYCKFLPLNLGVPARLYAFVFLNIQWLFSYNH